jgi:hypothetical protein
MTTGDPSARGHDAAIVRHGPVRRGLPSGVAVRPHPTDTSGRPATAAHRSMSGRSSLELGFDPRAPGHGHTADRCEETGASHYTNAGASGVVIHRDK